MGEIIISAPAVSAITLNDSGLGDSGASIENFAINPGNAHVVNNVQVTGTIAIWAVSHSTFVQQDAADAVDMQGPGTLEFPAETFGANPPPRIFVDTDEAVGFIGEFGLIGVLQRNVQLNFAGDTQVQQLYVDAGATGGTFTAGTGVAIGQVLAYADVTFGGSGTITAIDAMARGSTTISNVNGIPGVAPPVISGDITTSVPAASAIRIKAATPTGFGATAPNSENGTDGTIRIMGPSDTAVMEYRLKGATGTMITNLSAGTYEVRVAAVDPVLASNIVKIVVPAYTVKVTAIAVKSAGDATTVAVGGTLQMSATVTPSNAANQEVTWSVTNGTGTATVSTTGLVTATAAGTVTVKATANDDSTVYGENSYNNTSCWCFQYSI